MKPTRRTQGGQLAGNLMHFGRLLRQIGLPADPARVLLATRALAAVDVTRRDEVYWALHAVFVNRRRQRGLFAEAFQMFWRDPQGLDELLASFLPTLYSDDASQPPPISRRLAEALAQPRHRPPKLQEPEDEPVEFDASLTWSDREVLRHRDFEQMSGDEVEAAKRALADLDLTRLAVPTRRWQPWPGGGRIDPRRSLRAALRAGPDSIPLVHRRRRTRPPPLVVLCDISGSMARYARVLLHFVHTLTTDRDRVHAFVFGTRLTWISRHLRHRDVDRALAEVGRSVEDWEGGTRIGASLREFLQHWGRRVLGGGAWVLLITDGLDRGEGDELGATMARLHRSCRRLIWLNPLLRYDDFEPRAQGIRTMLPHVDDFRPCHDLASLEALCAALDAPTRRARTGGRRTS